MQQKTSATPIRNALPLMTTALLLLCAPGFGYQSAWFQSQATQGPQWFGSAPVQKEEFTITVFPDYLDVQLDWEISVGGNKPAEFTDALEIRISVYLEQNSTVIGMLLWNGNKILKAKLKNKDQARKAYEEVVDRNVIIPPRPRDPVLMERVSNDQYAISIFPVEWGGFRKMRLRYLVPSSAGAILFPRAFSQNAKITMLKGSGVKGFDLAQFKYDGYGLTDSVFASFSEGPLVLDSSKFNFRPATKGKRQNVDRVIPILEDASIGSRLYIGNFYGNGFAGQALNAVYHLPPGLLGEVAEPKDANLRIFATLMGEKDSCRKEINVLLGATKVTEELKILARGVVGESLKWSVFLNDELKKEVIEKPQIIRMEAGMQYARSFGNSKVYPWAEMMPFSLGSALGFIDKTYALLALEEDVLPAITAEKYLLSGVPTLNPEDIFPSKEDTAITANAWSAARGYKPNDLLLPAKEMTLGLHIGLPRGMSYVLRDGRLYIRLDRSLLDKEKGIRITLYSIKGKLVKEWGAAEISRGELFWSPSESGLSTGAYALRVRTGAGNHSQSVFLR